MWTLDELRYELSLRRLRREKAGNEALRRLVTNMMQTAESDPDRFRRKVADWGVFSFAMAILALFSGIALGMYAFYARSWIVLAACVPLCSSAAMLLRTQGPRFGNILLKQPDAPEFFGLLRTVAAELQVRMPSRVWLSHRDVLAATFEPSGGLITRPSSDLVIGAPLLAALSEEELRAALKAHMSELSGTNGLARAWSGSLDRSWSTVASWSRSWAVFPLGLLLPAIDWVALRAKAADVCLCRLAQFQGDRLSYESCGQAALTSVLKQFMLFQTGDWREGRVFRRLLAGESPVSSYRRALLDASVPAPAPDEVGVSLRCALFILDYAIMHEPRLAPRLKRLGYPLGPESEAFWAEKMALSGPPSAAAYELASRMVDAAPEWLTDSDESTLGELRLAARRLREDSVESVDSRTEAERLAAVAHRLPPSLGWELVYSLRRRFAGPWVRLQCALLNPDPALRDDDGELAALAEDPVVWEYGLAGLIRRALSRGEHDEAERVVEQFWDRAPEFRARRRALSHPTRWGRYGTFAVSDEARARVKTLVADEPGVVSVRAITRRLSPGSAPTRQVLLFVDLRRLRHRALPHEISVALELDSSHAVALLPIWRRFVWTGVGIEVLSR